MTETSNLCPECGGTGFVPPFMDPCDRCKAGFDAKVDVTAEAMAAERTAALEKLVDQWLADADETLAAPTGLPPLTSVPPFAPIVGTIRHEPKTAWTGAQVWTGSEWKPISTEALTPDEFHAKYPAEAVADEIVDHYGEDAITAAVAAVADPHGDADLGAVLDKLAAKAAVVAKLDGVPLAEYTAPGKRLATASQHTLFARLVAERDPVHPVVAHAIAKAAPGTLTTKEMSTLIDALLKVPANPALKAPRANNYDGNCRDCGGPVPAKTGVIRQIDGRWQTFHAAGGCLSTEAKAELVAERVTEPGLYKHEMDSGSVTPATVTRVFRVRKARTSSRLYAELVIPHLDGSVEFAYNAKAMGFLRRSNKLTWAEARDFGAAYGACVACGRTLSDNRSLVQGYGATCAGHFGWPTVTAKQAEAIIDGTMCWDDVITSMGVATS